MKISKTSLAERMIALLLAAIGDNEPEEIQDEIYSLIEATF